VSPKLIVESLDYPFRFPSMKMYYLPELQVSGKFPLGVIILSSAAAEVLLNDDVRQALHRHANCEWGNITPQERERNERGLTNGVDNLLSAHRGSNGVDFNIATLHWLHASFVHLTHDR
jgi:hypothetical protein